MYGWVDDVAHWLDNKHYLILPTVHEGNPYSVLEAAAVGIRPLVHTFPGAYELYPEDWTFRTAEEFVDRLKYSTYVPARHHRYVAHRYGLKEQVESINELLRALLD